MNDIFSLYTGIISLKITSEKLCKSPELVFPASVSHIPVQESSPVAKGCVEGSASFLWWEESELSQLRLESGNCGVVRIQIGKTLSLIRSLLTFPVLRPLLSTAV